VLGPVEEVRPVRQAGELVLERLSPQVRLGDLALADVADRS
jgi:hypothetical protein